VVDGVREAGDAPLDVGAGVRAQLEPLPVPAVAPDALEPEQGDPVAAQAQVGDERHQQRVNDHLGVDIEIGRRGRGDPVETRRPGIEQAVQLARDREQPEDERARQQQLDLVGLGVEVAEAAGPGHGAGGLLTKTWLTVR